MSSPQTFAQLLWLPPGHHKTIISYRKITVHVRLVRLLYNCRKKAIAVRAEGCDIRLLACSFFAKFIPSETQHCLKDFVLPRWKTICMLLYRHFQTTQGNRETIFKPKLAKVRIALFIIHHILPKLSYDALYKKT